MNETSQKRIKQHCCGGLRYSPNRNKKCYRGQVRGFTQKQTPRRHRNIRERANPDTHSRARRPPPARTSADHRSNALSAKTHVLRHCTRCVAAHTRGLTHTRNILYETSQKRIRKNCRGGFSPSTARVAQHTPVWGKTPPNRQQKRAEVRYARGAGRGRRGGRGSPPPLTPLPPRCEHGAEEDQGASRRVPHLDRCD